MDEKDLKALQESVTTLQTTVSEAKDENARLRETLALREAKDAVKDALANQNLPDATKARLTESLPTIAPMKDGALDVEAFKTKIAEAVKAEVEYITKAAGLGSIRGLGESAHEDDEQSQETLQSNLVEAFADLGLSESGAKIAAKGRA